MPDVSATPASSYGPPVVAAASQQADAQTAREASGCVLTAAAATARQAAVQAARDVAAASPGAWRPSAWERSLSAIFGFGQGCCINMYLSAAGYYGSVFRNERFFVWMCACVYLPPFLVFPAAKKWDHYFDGRFGPRAVFQVRLAISLLVAGALIACLSLVEGGSMQEFFEVLALGAGVGLVTGSLANSSSKFFGALAPALTSWFYLGQTASGAYVNVAARAFGFEPGCPAAAVERYYVLGVSVALVPSILYYWSQRKGRLEDAYRIHGRLIEQRSRNASSNSLARAAGEDDSHAADPGTPDGANVARQEVGRGFLLVCKACQVAAVFQNMSLTPLANRLAHGDYRLGQEIVLLKLLSDFVGRTVFYAIPSPKRLSAHLALNVLLQLCRVPVWALLVREVVRSEPGLGEPVLLAVWMPFVSAGALGGSWSTVVALEAVPPESQTDTAGAMTTAVYLGFLSGLIFAVAVSYIS